MARDPKSPPSSVSLSTPRQHQRRSSPPPDGPRILSGGKTAELSSRPKASAGKGGTKGAKKKRNIQKEGREGREGRERAARTTASDASLPPPEKMAKRADIITPLVPPSPSASPADQKRYIRDLEDQNRQLMREREDLLARITESDQKVRETYEGVRRLIESNPHMDRQEKAGILDYAKQGFGAALGVIAAFVLVDVAASALAGPPPAADYHSPPHEAPPSQSEQSEQQRSNTADTGNSQQNANAASDAGVAGNDNVGGDLNGFDMDFGGGGGAGLADANVEHRQVRKPFSKGARGTRSRPRSSRRSE